MIQLYITKVLDKSSYTTTIAHRIDDLIAQYEQSIIFLVNTLLSHRIDRVDKTPSQQVVL